MKSIHNEEDAAGALAQLLSLVGAISGLMDRGMTERGLTEARGRVLWALKDAGPVTQKALADRLGVTPRNVTGLIDGLEENGYASREKHPTDRRAVLVVLTEQGEKFVDGLKSELNRWAGRLFADVPGTDLEVFTRVLATLDERMRRPR